MIRKLSGPRHPLGPKHLPYTARAIAAVSPRTSIGGVSSAASPATSGRLEVLEQATGVSQATASSTGRQSPDGGGNKG